MRFLRQSNSATLSPPFPGAQSRQPLLLYEESRPLMTRHLPFWCRSGSIYDTSDASCHPDNTCSHIAIIFPCDDPCLGGNVSFEEFASLDMLGGRGRRRPGRRSTEIVAGYCCLLNLARSVRCIKIGRASGRNLPRYFEENRDVR